MFMARFEHVISTISYSILSCLIAGTIILFYLLKCEEHIQTETFVNNVNVHSLIATITGSARFCNLSAILIDNIFINKPKDLLISGIFMSNISDHFQFFYVSKLVTISLPHSIILNCFESYRMKVSINSEEPLVILIGQLLRQLTIDKTNRKSTDLAVLNITADYVPIQFIDITKFHGVIINSTLTWHVYN